MKFHLPSIFAATLAVAVMAGCGEDDEGSEKTLVRETDRISALLAEPDGGLLYTDRLSGEIKELGPDGEELGTIASVEVSSAGQQGLLGIARDAGGDLYAAWTDPDERLVVAMVAPERRDVWLGPEASDLGVGGRIAFAPDGRLVIGVGDLQDRERVEDPQSPNGKMLALDPRGRPDQEPEVLSSGWTNPFAFTFLDDKLWVADNAVGDAAERLARGDTGEASKVTELPPVTAPSGLAALPGGRLALCGYVSQELIIYRVGASGAQEPDDEPVATDCSLGVVELEDGRLAYVSDDDIEMIDAPPPSG